VSSSNLLNEAQQRRLLANAKHADELLSNIEEVLTASESKSAFPKYRPDVSLHQARLIRSHITRFRNHLTRVLAAVGVRHEGTQFGSLHSIRVALTFVRIAVQEMAPEYLRGYGNLPDEAVIELRGLCSELEGLLAGLERNLALGEDADLQARLDRLQQTTREAELLRLLDGVVNEHDLAEFRSPLLNLMEKLESRQFEIAVFGRVSSGKSSLLNHVLHTNVLPVGVNPITAVPTRLVFGAEPHLTVMFADRQIKRYPIGDLAQYASEERNPGNQLEVARLVVRLPSPRLQEGLVLVDTPGLGALATAGTAETLAYLPQCDLGMVLISAVNPINDEDLSTIHALSQAGIPVMALLSKADLLSSEDRGKALAYTRQEVLANLNLRLSVHPVSSAAGHEDLLESWFRDELAPLYGRHRELAQQSVRRKAGAMLENVTTALRSKVGIPAAADRDTGRLEQTERGLREAAGHIEEARQFCLSAADSVRSLGTQAIESAAAAVAGSWNGGGARRTDTAAVLVDAMERSAAGAAAEISSYLQTLAQALDSALRQAAEELGRPAGSEGSLRDYIREMPRFELPLPEVALSAPWFRFSKRLAHSWATRELRAHAQPSADTGFTNYGRSLETWTRRVLAEMQGQFEARADTYRAQLGRLVSPKKVSLDEKARIGAEVARLERFMAGGDFEESPAVGDRRESSAPLPPRT
jgi:GTP-binding protein EngB required for normal cell division